ncbi:MAG: hypothetical protein M1821_002240 [Bathelium mastoideum]|nr:MAG: hypothetical protein M1821_002240 [Bathelium mastoideum]
MHNSNVDTAQSSAESSKESLPKDKSSTDDKKKEPLAPTGSLSQIRNLYEAEHRRHALPWTAEYPDDLEEPLENAESAQFALLARYKKCYDMRKKLQLDSLVVQSPLLKAVLASVLEKYPGVTMSLERVEFSEPFEPFVHRWEQFAEARAQEAHPETREHLDLLWNVLEEEVRDTIREKQDLANNGVVTFDSVWTIFEPGALVFRQKEGHDRIYRLKSGTYSKTSRGKYYTMRCEYVDFDGEKFGVGQDSIRIPPFVGTLDIAKLPAYPVDRHVESESLKKRLVARGKLFEAYKGYHFKAYRGIAIDERSNERNRYNVHSRIIIDTQAHNRFNPHEKVNLQKILSGEGDFDFDDDSENGFEYLSDNDEDDADAVRITAPEVLTEEQLLICKPTLRGYSLKDKKWLEFYIDSVEDVTWNEDAFDSLVAPPEQKDLVLAFAQSQSKNREGFDDVIQGKGRGMIILLSGPPGVGKTLTAESVAESLKVPLYTLSAGDLGSWAEDVESKLRTVLEISTKWNAVVLLDEADVFLEARSAHDLSRNQFVSVFLRLLEYFEGMLFLTTNRVDSIDAAFDSRIHLTLEYDELDMDSRRHIWRTFLKKADNVGEFLDQEVDKLAETNMNGRQIKNVLKVAQLLAAKKEEALAFRHVEVVLKLRATNALKRRPFKTS